MTHHRPATAEAADAASWSEHIYGVLKQYDVRQVAFVPDGGHAELIRRVQGDPAIRAVALTTEEEGVALLAGAWLGGQRGVLLMQSSGVGNCINMIGLMRTCRFPFAAFITMRGQWHEFNPWQMPMGLAAEACLKAIGVTVLRAETGPDLIEMVEQAASMAFDGDQQIAVLIGQRLLGKKKW